MLPAAFAAIATVAFMVGFVGVRNPHPVYTVTRAAIDIGSGITKLLVAEVEGRPPRVVARTLLSDETEILLRRDLLQQQETTQPRAFSAAIRSKLCAQMVEYREAAHRLGAGQVAAIATAAFREVADGASLLEELKQALGVPVEVVSQETEGQLGFFTAGVACPDVPQDRMVVWDSGGGSFQMTSLYKGDILMYGHSTGSSLATKALVHDVQGHQYVGQSPNPVSLEEAFALRRLLTDRLPEPPVWLRAKVRRPDVTVLGIGGSTCIFNLAAQVVGRPEFTLEEVWAAAQSLANQTDAQLGWYPQRDMVISKLSLMAAVMAKCGVPRVRYCPCNGNTQGMLVYDRLWPA